jgi:malonyl-CoA O-methyltransferase
MTHYAGLKDKIAANFTASAPFYDHYAVLQQQAAKSLVTRLEALKGQIPTGPLLEVGCGTGAVSLALASMLPHRRLTLIDLAPGMIAYNRSALAPLLASRPAHVDWQVCDAETISNQSTYALITSCLTLQWLHDLPRALDRLCSALVPDGILICSYLGDRSFPEWQQAAESCGLAYTANPLPNSQQTLAHALPLGHLASTEEELVTISYSSVLDFFRSLKKTGTSTPTSTNRLSRRDMARLITGWQRQAGTPVPVTYQINTLLVRR